LDIWKIQPYFFTASAFNLNRSADSNTSGRLSTKHQDKNQKKSLLTDYYDHEEYCLARDDYNKSSQFVVKLQQLKN
jgi:hypothetical protein